MNSVALYKDILAAFQKNGVSAENFAQAKNIIQGLLTFVENLFLTGSATDTVNEAQTVSVFGSNYKLTESLTITGNKQ